MARFLATTWQKVDFSVVDLSPTIGGDSGRMRLLSVYGAEWTGSSHLIMTK